jgi:hypothetical protein
MQTKLASILQNDQPLDLYSVTNVLCHDLTGDGNAEMVVLLGCCTGSSPDPWAIFEPAGREWDLAFARVSQRLNVANLRIREEKPYATLVERVPVYGPTDPNCCPSSFRSNYFRWNGQEFARVPAGTSPTGGTAPAGVTTSCGDLVKEGAGTYDVQATGVDCPLARRIAREWEKQCASSPHTCTISSGYSCNTKVLGEELAHITCRSGARSVEFSSGA